ncbi:efflux RND transporter permease subunit [Parendozoicomonas haliclonae]|uniref:Efflux pump membrane transporter BepE n=1 Tax=Parendozoicomonas haliclonae TaxID=1960125 RepID=A0A1X7AKD3_9GAMM|nr:efflux RND transporter permease subunit [Parendozoicomonas haliclonae]SMA47720.1 Efflux pump membrane transporter BepE [Parendozoicomonas haliclonae]
MSWLRPEGAARRLFLDSLLAKLLLTLFILMGLTAWNTLVRENYPDLEIPMALVITEWPGASPEQVEKEVTKYIEEEINGLKGLIRYESGSYNSYSMISVEFDADLPVSDAMQRLRAAVSKAESEFPANSGVKKPDIEEMTMSDTPVVNWVLHGDASDLLLTDTAQWVQEELEKIDGVKKVDISGQREKSLHVRLYPEKLRMLGLSPITVKNLLLAANRDMGWGEFEGDSNTFSLYQEGRFDSVDAVRQLPVMRTGDNAPVRLGDIADIQLRPDRQEMITGFSLNGAPETPGVILGVKKRPGADTLGVIAESEVVIGELMARGTWPVSLTVTKVSDDAELIETAFNDIASSMFQAVLIVFAILMLLLTWRAALIAGLAIPVTLLAVLGLMIPLGYSFNSMVMIGMVLALGLLVDVFILVMEGMHEGLYVRKESFTEAALKTVKTFAMPAIAGQLTTILALVPMMMVGGVDGKFIRILPITITLALIISLIIAFLICIPLSRTLLVGEKPHGELPVDKLARITGTRLKTFLLNGPLSSRGKTLGWAAGAFSLFLLTVMGSSLLPSMMYPEADDRKIGVSIELPPDATLEQSRQVTHKASEWLRAQPWIEKFVVYTGARSPVTSGNLQEAILPNENAHLAGFTILLYPKDQREKLSFDYLPDIRQGLESVLADEPGLRIQLTHVGGNPDTAAPVAIALVGPDYQILRDISTQVKARMAQEPGATDIRDNLGAALPEARFTFDREMLNFFGLDESDVSQQVRLAMGDDEYGRFKSAGTADDPKLRLGYLWPSREGELGNPRHVAEVSLMQVISPKGDVVPLETLSEYDVDSVPRVYIHKDGRRAITVQARAEGQTASEIMLGMQADLEQMKQDWPAGYSYELGGELTKAGDSYSDMGMAFIAAVLLILILLALLYNSIRQPIIILLIIPLGLTGTLGGFFLTNIPLSFSGLIGIVALVGIAVNNAIVLIDTANRHVVSGLSVVEAAAQASSDRLRPIVSTTMTTVLGLMPLAFSDPQWYPLCMAIVYGLVVSTAIALVIIPCLYALLVPERLEAQTESLATN